METISVIRMVYVDGSSILYRETWFDGTNIFIHEGRVGDRGKTRKVSADISLARTLVRSFQAQAERDAYFLVNPEFLTDITITLKTEGFGSADQLNIRHRLEDELDEILGWSGNGRCTGGDAGGGSLQIHCEAIVPHLAIASIQTVLKKVAHHFDAIEVSQG